MRGKPPNKGLSKGKGILRKLRQGTQGMAKKVLQHLPGVPGRHEKEENKHGDAHSSSKNCTQRAAHPPNPTNIYRPSKETQNPEHPGTNPGGKER